MGWILGLKKAFMVFDMKYRLWQFVWNHAQKSPFLLSRSLDRGLAIFIEKNGQNIVHKSASSSSFQFYRL